MQIAGAASDAAAKNAYNEMQQLIPDIPKMNDAERLIFEGNLRRLKNKLEVSGLIPKTKVEGEVIGMESKEKITGEDLKKLTEEKGTVNPPTSSAGQLEQSAKKMENLGKNIEQEFTKGKKRSVSDILDEYFHSYSTMKQIEDEGLVRAVARQIMYADLNAGKTVLVTAHGNSLRAIVKHIDCISDEDIAKVNIPTGIPLLYEFGADWEPIKKGGEYLDPEAAKAAIEAGPLSGQPINIWCFQQMSIFPIGTDRLAREVVAEDKDNIRTSIGSSVLGCLSWTVLRSGDAGQKASQQQTATEHMGTF